MSAMKMLAFMGDAWIMLMIILVTLILRRNALEAATGHAHGQR